MSSSHASALPATPPFVCEHRVSSNEACRDELFYKEKEGKQYCVLHYPGAEKSAEFAAALGRRLAAGNYNFRYIWFSEKPQFGKFTFGREADFTHAVFHAGANFKESKFSADAYFYQAVFHAAADFYYSVFSGEAYFHYAVFGAETDFRFAKFERLAYFRGATFNAGANFEVAIFTGEADFTAIKFRAPAAFDLRTAANLGEYEFNEFKSRASANFSYTRISDYATFSSEGDPAFDGEAFFEFQFANIEKPERVSFRMLGLRPHWFVNVDARKFDLSNVDWNWRQVSRIKRWWGIPLKRELEELNLKRVATPHRVFSVACRNLALNAEENHRYEEASNFRFWAMDARRREQAGGFRPWTLGWWYWFASSYGESIPKAIVVFVAIWLGFAFLYYSSPHYRCVPNTSDCDNCIGWVSPETCTQGCVVADATRECRPFNSFEFSVVYTIETMTLQKPDPRPKSPPARVFVLLCTILGPLQAALLALAVRRRFMR